MKIPIRVQTIPTFITCPARFHHQVSPQVNRNDCTRQQNEAQRRENEACGQK